MLSYLLPIVVEAVADLRRRLQWQGTNEVMPKDSERFFDSTYYMVSETRRFQKI